MRRSYSLHHWGWHLLRNCSLVANAADAMVPQVIYVPELSGDALEPASTTLFRSKMFGSLEG